MDPKSCKRFENHQGFVGNKHQEIPAFALQPPDDRLQPLGSEELRERRSCLSAGLQSQVCKPLGAVAGGHPLQGFDFAP